MCALGWFNSILSCGAFARGAERHMRMSPGDTVQAEPNEKVHWRLCAGSNPNLVSEFDGFARDDDSDMGVCSDCYKQ